MYQWASRALSKELPSRAFSFVGPTTMYAAMQACGLVDDHLAEIGRAAAHRNAAEIGEADAAVVYATDAAVAEGVDVIEIPDELNVLGTYPVATLSGSAQPELAQRFVDLVLSAQGQRILTGRGFQGLE